MVSTVNHLTQATLTKAKADTQFRGIMVLWIS